MAIFWSSPNAAIFDKIGLCCWRQAGKKIDAAYGDNGHLPKAANHDPESGTQAVSIFAAQFGNIAV